MLNNWKQISCNNLAKIIRKCSYELNTWIPGLASQIKTSKSREA